MLIHEIESMNENTGQILKNSRNRKLNLNKIYNSQN